MRHSGLRYVVVVAAVAAIAAPAALAGARAANPLGLLLAKGDVPGRPYAETDTLRPAQAKADVLGRTVGYGANSPAYKVAGKSSCAARFFTTQTAVGQKQAFSYVCVTPSTADAKVLAKALIGKRKDFVKQPGSGCQGVSPGLGQSSGMFRWCPYKPRTSFWSTSFIGIWSDGKIVAVYGHEYPELEKRPDLNDVLPGLRKLSAKVKAAS
jgi:hypothetical protein